MMTYRQMHAICTSACLFALVILGMHIHRDAYDPGWHRTISPVPEIVITPVPVPAPPDPPALQPVELVSGSVDGLPFRVVQYHPFRGPINVNTAPEELLELLPGVGKSTALAMVLVRRRIGGFKTPEDLMLVTGIGPRSLEKIRPMITCGAGNESGSER